MRPVNTLIYFNLCPDLCLKRKQSGLIIFVLVHLWGWNLIQVNASITAERATSVGNSHISTCCVLRDLACSEGNVLLSCETSTTFEVSSFSAGNYAIDETFTRLAPVQTQNPSPHHHHSSNREGRWGTTDDFATTFLRFSLFSTAHWDLPNSRPVHSHLFHCPPCLLPPFTVPCRMVLATPDERETWPYHCSLHLFTIVSRSSCGPIACWILARTSSLVTWPLYEMRSILR